MAEGISKVYFLRSSQIQGEIGRYGSMEVWKYGCLPKVSLKDLRRIFTGFSGVFFVAVEYSSRLSVS